MDAFDISLTPRRSSQRRRAVISAVVVGRGGRPPVADAVLITSPPELGSRRLPVRPARARWLARLGRGVIVAVACLLALAYLLPQDFWDTRTPYLWLCAVAFLVRLLQFQIGLLIVMIAVAAAVGRRRNLALAALALGALAAGPALWPMLRLRQEPAAVLSPLRLMSFNLNADNLDADAVDRQVRLADPDVVALQEFRDIHRALFREKLMPRYPYVGISTTNAGVAVYSKLPLRLSTAPQFAGVHGVTRARYEIDMAGSTFALYAVHVPRFDSIADLARSRLELARLLAYVESDPLPVVIAGDFNFTDLTPNAAAIRQDGFKSAYDLAGEGWDVTRPIKFPLGGSLLGFRIDHVFVKSPLTCTRFAVGGDAGSDHLPVIADLAWERSIRGNAALSTGGAAAAATTLPTN